MRLSGSSNDERLRNVAHWAERRAGMGLYTSLSRDSVIQLGTESDETCELGPGRRVFPAETGATRLKSFQLNEKITYRTSGDPSADAPSAPP